GQHSSAVSRRLLPWRPDGPRHDRGAASVKALRASDFALRTATHPGTQGAEALGCEIKEEAAAAGRRRGTFAPKRLRSVRLAKRTDAALSSRRLPPLRPGG